MPKENGVPLLTCAEVDLFHFLRKLLCDVGLLVESATPDNVLEIMESIVYGNWEQVRESSQGIIGEAVKNEIQSAVEAAMQDQIFFGAGQRAGKATISKQQMLGRLNRSKSIILPVQQHTISTTVQDQSRLSGLARIMPKPDTELSVLLDKIYSEPEPKSQPDVIIVDYPGPPLTDRNAT
jgi:hypothetical protein